MPIHPQLDEILNYMSPLVRELHSAGSLAPVAATMDKTGELNGDAYIVENSDDSSANLSIQDVLDRFEKKHREAAAVGEIVASAIFFHGVALSEPIRPAQTYEEACTIVGLVEHIDGDSFFFVVPYEISEDVVNYLGVRLIEKPATVFQAPQTGN